MNSKLHSFDPSRPRARAVIDKLISDNSMDSLVDAQWPVKVNGTGYSGAILLMPQEDDDPNVFGLISLIEYAEFGKTTGDIVKRIAASPEYRAATLHNFPLSYVLVEPMERPRNRSRDEYTQHQEIVRHLSGIAAAFVVTTMPSSRRNYAEFTDFEEWLILGTIPKPVPIRQTRRYR